MQVYQPPLFTVDLVPRHWCGYVWLTIVWRDWNGEIFGEFNLEVLI